LFIFCETCVFKFACLTWLMVTCLLSIRDWMFTVIRLTYSSDSVQSNVGDYESRECRVVIAEFHYITYFSLFSFIYCLFTMLEFNTRSSRENKVYQNRLNKLRHTYFAYFKSIMAQVNYIKEPPIFSQTTKNFIYWKRCLVNYLKILSVWKL
jgi:hypothetical protein